MMVTTMKMKKTGNVMNSTENLAGYGGDDGMMIVKQKKPVNARSVQPRNILV
jgi:hypothetical protein